MLIQDILLAQDVKRWGIVRTIKDQSLAEHTFNVTMIARAICKEYGLDDENVIKYALDHDIAEIVSSDIPSPAKSRMGIKDEPQYASKSKKVCSKVEVAIVKFADIMEAVSFIRDNKVGRHAEVVYSYLVRHFHLECNKWVSEEPELVKAVERVVQYMTVGEFEAEKYE